MQALNNYVILNEVNTNISHKGDLLPSNKKSLQVVSIGEKVGVHSFNVGDIVIADIFQGDRQTIDNEEVIIVTINQVKAKV